MTLMTRNGVSTTAKGEQYETFYSAHRGKKVSRVMYDYRDTDNKLFSCVLPLSPSADASVTNGSKQRKEARNENDYISCGYLH